MAQNGQADVLNDLFNNHGVHLEKLPEGYAAGAGARAIEVKNSLYSRVIDDLSGKNWRGKIFFPSENPRMTRGLNRIKQTQLLKPSITPMVSFVARLWDKHPLVPAAKSNLITLSYEKPVTQNYWQELALTQIQIYDVIVAVPGKYGPVFIGKTWLGKYAENRDFIALDKNQMTAWFFLDFNAQALSIQQAEHWDGAKEKLANMFE
jgi:hypothetical protein